jgi:hypothetical protein
LPCEPGPEKKNFQEECDTEDLLLQVITLEYVCTMIATSAGHANDMSAAARYAVRADQERGGIPTTPSKIFLFSCLPANCRMQEAVSG